MEPLRPFTSKTPGDVRNCCSPERGTKHLHELAKAVGFQPVLMFVIQMDGITEVRGNQETDPAFCEALEDAKKAGVKVIFLPCHVEPDGLSFAAI